MTWSIRTPASTCCSFARLLKSSAAPQISTTEAATSPITIVRRAAALEPDDPRAAWLMALDSLPKEVCKEGSRPVRIRTAITAAAANPRTRRSMLRSAVNGSDAATSGAAARSISAPRATPATPPRSRSLLRLVADWLARRACPRNTCWPLESGAHRCPQSPGSSCAPSGPARRQARRRPILPATSETNASMRVNVSEVENEGDNLASGRADIAGHVLGGTLPVDGCDAGASGGQDLRC